MQRRKFLETAGRAGVGLGLTTSLCVPEALGLAGDQNASAKAASGMSGPMLAASLDGDWLIATDPNNTGREEQWFQSPKRGAKTIKVPSIIQEPFPAYHGVVWYWRTFDATPLSYKSGRYQLRFSAVDYLADVWLNNTHLGSHEGAETPFAFDVTSAIRPTNNQLTVRVLNPKDQPIDGFLLGETPHRNKFVKYTNGALSDYGGIIESVDLLMMPAVHITDVFVKPDWKTGKVPASLTVVNTQSSPCQAHLQFSVSTDSVPQIILNSDLDATLKPGENVLTAEFEIRGHKLWDIVEPNLYRLQTSVECSAVEGTHRVATNFGFRDFRVVNGYFHLNGRRLLVKSTHTGNHCPYRIVSPPEGYPDMLLKDLIYAKASGFNTVRFISGVTHPWELDMCDEIGLMVYEECAGAWLLKDSPQMKRRYEDSIRSMILRDRNHPSITLFGVLNETEDGPVYREAVSVLPFLRTLDDTRLLILSSGRFDGHTEVGSFSNPGSHTWEYAWANEAPAGAKVAMKYPTGIGAGDFHLYPKVPQTVEVDRMIRALGEGGGPVFLSEYGIGSMMDVLHELRMYEQAGIPTDAEDYILMKHMADGFTADWAKFGMESAYPFPESLLHASQAAMARHRIVGFNAIRANPKICGFNLTGMLDHAFTGEGVWRFWRDWKPGAFDAMQDGWAPVRWCLFAEPTHTYSGRPINIEAVLANEDAVRPGEYSAQFQLWGPKGSAWHSTKPFTIPIGPNAPLAVPVLKEQVTVATAGSYEFVPYIAAGIAPPETSLQFTVTDPSSLPRLNLRVTTIGIDQATDAWLKSHGVSTARMTDNAGANREVILVGDISANAAPAQWKSLAERMARGSTVIFLDAQTFKREKDGSARLPLARKGRVYEFNDWLYHKECVAKPHQVFEGLQGPGLLDWYYWGPVLPRYVFDGQDTPGETLSAAFAAGYSTDGGYASGVLLGSYQFGAGRFFVNSFGILGNVDKHPAADRLLLNLMQYTASSANGPLAPLPADFAGQLKQIGYAD